MGIGGLLPFLKKASKITNLKKYRGCSAAVDGLAWLHKGSYGCAVKLGLGEPTDAYVVYCMNYVNLLLRNGIRPVIVFDGRSLISKEPTNRKRREAREANRKKGLELVQEGDKTGSREYFFKSIEITHEMIYAWIKVLRQHHIDYIVAPFEADAQLAYLSGKGIVDLVITEDSDLTVFGCPQILFKLKMDGSCVLYKRSKIHLCLGLSAAKFKFEKFRRMCILSGCDYLGSLRGIGLARARKLVRLMTTQDIAKVIKSIPKFLNLYTEVSDDYIDGFLKAENTFMYQLVFDPLTRQVVPLNHYLPDVDPLEMPYAGTNELDSRTAFEMALGNINTKTLETVDDSFDIDKEKGYAQKVTSIWSKKFVNQPTKTVHSRLKTVVSISKNLQTKKRPLPVDEIRAENVDPQEVELLLAALSAKDKSHKSKTTKGTFTNRIHADKVTPKLEGQQLKTKHVKILASTSKSLRKINIYNRRVTRNRNAANTNARLNHDLVNDKYQHSDPANNSGNKHSGVKINALTNSPDIGLLARGNITIVHRHGVTTLKGMKMT